MEQATLYIKRLSENATIPVRGSPFSAGYDLFRFFLLNINLLYSAKDMVVKAHGKGLVPTDLSVAIPKNCYGRVGMIS